MPPAGDDGDGPTDDRPEDRPAGSDPPPGGDDSESLAPDEDQSTERDGSTHPEDQSDPHREELSSTFLRDEQDGQGGADTEDGQGGADTEDGQEGDGEDGQGRDDAGDGQRTGEPDGETGAAGPESPPDPRPGSARPGSQGPVRWFLHSNQPAVVFAREFLGSVVVVLLLGSVLFAASGVWPPMVAVESGSMEPHMHRGDLVFVMDEQRLGSAAAIEGTGIATHRSGAAEDYRRFGTYGDVIVYRKNGNEDGTPIIHRARFWVNESENWVRKANRSHLGGQSCSEVSTCPADHAGFITKGDANSQYDQLAGISDVVAPEWVKGTAELRIPWLGHVRLGLSKLLGPSLYWHTPVGDYDHHRGR